MIAQDQFIRGEDYSKNINYVRHYIPNNLDAVNNKELQANRLEYIENQKKYKEFSEKAYQFFSI